MSIQGATGCDTGIWNIASPLSWRSWLQLRYADIQRPCCTGENPTRLVGMLIPEKALPDLLAELQSTEQGQQELAEAAPMRYVSEGPVKGSLRDIQ